MKKIAITGTKGKTTITLILDQVLRGLHRNVLRVDTTGSYINNQLHTSKDLSLTYTGLVPTRAPGRFLSDAYRIFGDDFDAVLECSLGSSNLAGLAYKEHDIGVFTNVYDDHLGSVARLKTREDIAEAKKFVFTQIAPNGFAVYNSDDELVVKKSLDLTHDVRQVTFGLQPVTFKNDQHIAHVTLQDNTVIIVRNGQPDLSVLRPRDIAWTFGGNFTPSVYNALAIVGALYAYFDGQPLTPACIEAVRISRLDPRSGRLVHFNTPSGVTILADYAHETRSLTHIAALAHSLTKDRGSTIGVVRLAWDRIESQIYDTGRAIGSLFDTCIVYDKVDGYWRQAQPNARIVAADGTAITQKVGRVSQILTDAIHSVNTKVERIIREDQAIARAADLAKPGDVVVVIVNDDIERSLGFIQQYFGLGETKKPALITLGRAEEIRFPELGLPPVPARIDTGAKTSSIWASDVTITDGVLYFTLFDPRNPNYPAVHQATKDFEKLVVASSNGTTQERYKIKLLVALHGKKIRASFTLADRSQQVYPVLIGRNILHGKFIVNVKQGKPLYAKEKERSEHLQADIKGEEL